MGRLLDAAGLESAGEPELVRDEPWARVSRVPLAGGGAAWLKECAPVQAFEVPLTVALAGRWPDRLPEVLGHDPEGGRLLLGDAGSPLQAFGDAEDAWLAALPLYAELQRGETAHAAAHLAAGVPDQRVETLAERLEELPRLRHLAPRLAELCARLTLPPTVQHDDLHGANVYARDGRIVFLDWGDCVIGHPFASLTVTLRTYAGDPAPLRDAYLEPWGRAYREELDAALQVGAFTRILSWQRIGDERMVAANVEWLLENVASS